MTHIVGLYDVVLQRSSILTPCVDVTAVCLPAHEEGKQKAAEEEPPQSDSCTPELVF